MSDIYDDPSSGDASFRQLVAHGKAALGRGDASDAIRHLFAAARDTGASDDDYVRALALLRDAFVRLSRFREALAVEWYRLAAGPKADIAPSLLERVPPSARARTQLLVGEPRAAAELFEQAGEVVHAAIAFERAGDWARARALWSRLAHSLATGNVYLYEAGLAHFNLFRASHRLGDARAARTAVSSSVHFLEDAADRYETAGERERAFDCFHVLVSIGRATHVFEHVLEGYVNLLRILREDHLRNYALQMYEEAIGAARDAGELVAAASLARELASYARAEGQAEAANHAIETEAQLWQGVAQAAGARGASAVVAENALLAAAVALSEIGQHEAVRRVYDELSRVARSERSRAHYARAGARFAAATNAPLEARPLAAHLRQDAGFPEVWHVDLVEWEARGSAFEACADIVLDASGTVSETTRRRALVAALLALASDAAPNEPSPALGLTYALSDLELWSILAPLEALIRRREPEVRIAVLEALGRFHYKRTFVAVRAGLADAHAGVARAASKTLQELCFTQAFDPLARLYRESSSPAVRLAAIAALCKIEGLPEVAELLLEVLSFGPRDEREAVSRGLKEGRAKTFFEVARAVLADGSSPAREAVREIFHAHGLA